jgi:hypothetical protein
VLKKLTTASLRFMTNEFLQILVTLDTIHSLYKASFKTFLKLRLLQSKLGLVANRKSVSTLLRLFEILLSLDISKISTHWKILTKICWKCIICYLFLYREFWVQKVVLRLDREASISIEISWLDCWNKLFEKKKFLYGRDWVFKMPIQILTPQVFY